MGAFTFAMGTLSSISSVFVSSKSGRKNAINLNDFRIELDSNAQRAFAEFSTGMQMLYKHSVHNSFNVATVTEQNLKLLHSNLKSNQAYKKTISQIRSRSVESNHWAWLPLFSDQDISAGLIYLPAGHTVAPNTAGANVTIRQNTLHTPFSHTQVNESGHQLYLGLMGNTAIECQSPTFSSATYGTTRNYGTAKQSGSLSVTLKRNDAFIENPLHKKVQRLCSGQEPSLILNVHLLHAN
ncbi:hypothetical protein [Kaarinaea lacus]